MSVGDGRQAERVRVVTFDAGLTLLRAAPSFRGAFVEALAAAGVPVPDEPVELPLPELWERHDARWREAGRPSPHVGDTDAERDYWRGLYRRLLEHLGVDGEHGDLAGSIADHFASPGVFRPYPDVLEELEHLATRGCRLALLSNWGRTLRDILAAEGLLDLFEVVVISGEVGVAKPSPEIYHRLLDRLGESAGPHVAYVGDSLEHDVRPSRRLGLTPVLMDRRDRHPGHEGARITGLAELHDVLHLPGRRPDG